ncbi:MAG: hypothetical protein WCP97_04080 [bacterium]
MRSEFSSALYKVREISANTSSTVPEIAIPCILGFAAGAGIRRLKNMLKIRRDSSLLNIERIANTRLIYSSNPSFYQPLLTRITARKLEERSEIFGRLKGAALGAVLLAASYFFPQTLQEATASLSFIPTSSATLLNFCASALLGYAVSPATAAKDLFKKTEQLVEANTTSTQGYLSDLAKCMQDRNIPPRTIENLTGFVTEV